MIEGGTARRSRPCVPTRAAGMPARSLAKRDGPRRHRRSRPHRRRERTRGRSIARTLPIVQSVGPGSPDLARRSNTLAPGAPSALPRRPRTSGSTATPAWPRGTEQWRGVSLRNDPRWLALSYEVSRTDLTVTYSTLFHPKSAQDFGWPGFFVPCLVTSWCVGSWGGRAYWRAGL